MNIITGFLSHYNTRKRRKECEIEGTNKRVFIKLPAFSGRNVPISELAKATGKNTQYLHLGLQQGYLKFSVALKKENSSEYNYYCSDKQVWEETGYFNASY